MQQLNCSSSTTHATLSEHHRACLEHLAANFQQIAAPAPPHKPHHHNSCHKDGNLLRPPLYHHPLQSYPQCDPLNVLTSKHTGACPLGNTTSSSSSSSGAFCGGPNSDAPTQHPSLRCVPDSPSCPSQRHPVLPHTEHYVPLPPSPPPPSSCSILPDLTQNCAGQQPRANGTHIASDSSMEWQQQGQQQRQEQGQVQQQTQQQLQQAQHQVQHQQPAEHAGCCVRSSCNPPSCASTGTSSHPPVLTPTTPTPFEQLPASVLCDLLVGVRVYLHGRTHCVFTCHSSTCTCVRLQFARLHIHTKVNTCTQTFTHTHTHRHSHIHARTHRHHTHTH